MLRQKRIPLALELQKRGRAGAKMTQKQLIGMIPDADGVNQCAIHVKDDDRFSI